MALADLILKAKVNVAFARDPRVGVLDVGVRADDGHITLTGDVDSQEECRAAEEVAASVEGVTGVTNSITCGLGQRADTAELVSQKFMEKLDEEWNNLPDKSALAQADYLRWALWMVYKFRIPDAVAADDHEKTEADITDQALERIAGYVGIPKAMAALEMLRQAEMVNESRFKEAPSTGNAPLVSTPVVEGGNPAVAA